METDNEFRRITVHDLIANDAFLHWVQQPTEELDAYWKGELAKHPQLESTVREARWLIQQMRFSEDKPTAERKQVIFDRIKEEAGMEKPPKKTIPIRRWLQMVAVLSLVTITGVWMYTRYAGKPTNGLTDSPQKAALLEGGVFLSNGKTLSLADLKPGTRVEEGNVHISLIEANHLVYQYGEGTSEVQIDSVVSPIGALLHMELPDGSKVWLNSGSTMRLMGRYNDAERRMDIDGQGYFDVVSNTDVPFCVSFGKGEVTVLGTQFDIANYPNAPKTVTLLEGRVQVDHGVSQPLVIRPGQQLRYPAEGAEPIVSEVDVAHVIAWKNDVFSFQGDRIEAVMHQVGTWYGVDVVYEHPRPVQLITGTIPHGVTLDEMLAILEDIGSDAHFRIDGGRIVVSTGN